MDNYAHILILCNYFFGIVLQVINCEEMNKIKENAIITKMFSIIWGQITSLHITLYHDTELCINITVKVDKSESILYY